MSVNVYDPVNDELIPVAGATLFAEMPLGAIQAFDSTDIPSNFLEFKGQTVNRADYPDLWAHIVKNSLFGEGKFYGIGDGSTTFTLADLRETSLKGYGETSRSVGAHVKSGGLGIGEFIDDQLQNHSHAMLRSGSAGNVWATYNYDGLVGNSNLQFNYTRMTVFDSRSGNTTEVKAVGVVWAVKAKMTGLPIDLKEQVENYVDEVVSDPTIKSVTEGIYESNEVSVTQGVYLITINNKGFSPYLAVYLVGIEGTGALNTVKIANSFTAEPTFSYNNATHTISASINGHSNLTLGAVYMNSYY